MSCPLRSIRLPGWHRRHNELAPKSIQLPQRFATRQALAASPAAVAKWKYWQPGSRQAVRSMRARAELRIHLPFSNGHQTPKETPKETLRPPPEDQEPVAPFSA